MRLACPKCETTFQARPEAAGKRFRCRCGTLLRVPCPEPAPEEEVVLEVLPGDEEDLPEVQPADEFDDLPVVPPGEFDDLPVVPTAPRKKKKKPQTLIVHGLNGSAEIRGTHVIVRRRRTYKLHILSITEVKLTPGAVECMMRLVVGFERHPGCVPVFDDQTILFDPEQQGEFEQFRLVLERARRQLVEEYRLRRG